MGPFRLNLYYSIASGIAVVVMALVIASLYYVTEVGEKTMAAGARSEVLARTFSNVLWPEFGSVLTESVALDAKALRDRDVTQRILARLKEMGVGVPIIKVKMYNRDGIAVFSSVLSEIGENKSAQAGFVAALDGKVFNNLTHRGQISTTEGSIHDVDVVESYIPIRQSATAPITAVFEMYADVTQAIDLVQKTAVQLLTGLFVCFSVLYGVLILIVWRADSIIHGQYRALQKHDEQASAKNQELTDEIAERLKVEQALRETEKRAAEASRAKSEFLSMMSHELRTPLNSIMGFSEVLGERMFGELNAKQAEYVGDIHSSGKHLLSLINDVLDLSKIEAGRMELDVSLFDLQSTLHNVLALFREQAQRADISLWLDLDPALGNFAGDERKLNQIMLNLLSNALKFTGANGKVTVLAARSGDAVEIAVSDTGVGIAPADQEEVFVKFSQVGRDYLRKMEGTGLGLALVRRFVELHGGKIALKSVAGLGSTFTFTLMPQPVEGQ